MLLSRKYNFSHDVRWVRTHSCKHQGEQIRCTTCRWILLYYIHPHSSFYTTVTILAVCDYSNTPIYNLRLFASSVSCVMSYIFLHRHENFHRICLITRAWGVSLSTKLDRNCNGVRLFAYSIIEWVACEMVRAFAFRFAKMARTASRSSHIVNGEGDYAQRGHIEMRVQDASAAAHLQQTLFRPSARRRDQVRKKRDLKCASSKRKKYYTLYIE